MGIFDAIKIKKDLERLEKAAQEDPTAYNLTALVKRYWELNDIDNAIRVAKQALDRFPDVDEVFEIYSRLRKNQAQTEIDTLKKLIEERPNPAIFAQLSEIYMDLRDEDTALHYCRKSIEMFPNDDSAYLIIGELRLRRFYMDLLVKDGRLAMEYLEKTIEINNKNYKALVALAKFYLQIGMISKARQRLKNILLFAPEDDNVKDLLEISFKIPKPEHEDLDFLLQWIEDQRKLHYKLEKATQSVILTLSEEMFQEALQTFQYFPGIQIFLVCNEAGELLTYYNRSNSDIALAHNTAMTFHRAIQGSSRQMDIGRFHKSELECPFGNIHIMNSEGVVYILFTTAEIKRDQIRKAIQEFIVKVSNMRLNLIRRQLEHG